MIPDLTDAELDKLTATQSADEWNAVCDEIKKVRAGAYPPNWYKTVMSSGLCAYIQSKWAKGA